MHVPCLSLFVCVCLLVCLFVCSFVCLFVFVCLFLFFRWFGTSLLLVPLPETNKEGEGCEVKVVCLFV